MDTQRQWARPPGGEEPPGWRPPRHRTTGRLLVGVVLLLVVVLAVLAIASLSLWPSLPNPFATRRVDRSPPVLLQAIEDLHAYKAATGNFQVIVDLEKSSPGVPLAIKGERTLFVASGSVDAEVDFSGLTEGAIKVSEERRRLEVVLPRARLTPARVDPEQSRVFSRERGLLDRVGSVLSDNPTSERELYQLAAKRMLEAANRSDLRTRAEENTRAMLKTMLRSLGYDDVTVTFRGPPT